MIEWKMHDMENAHPEKGRIYHYWKKVENAHLENERMQIARYGKCKNGKRTPG